MMIYPSGMNAVVGSVSVVQLGRNPVCTQRVHSHPLLPIIGLSIVSTEPFILELRNSRQKVALATCTSRYNQGY